MLEKLLSNFNRKFSDDASAQLETLNTALAERWTAKGYDESYIEAHRMTIYDLVTVASMIEKETASAKESSTIASVIYNRLVRSRKLSVPERRRNDRLCARRRRWRADV